MTEEIKDNLEEATNELAVALAAIQIEESTHTRESKSYVVMQKFGTDCNIEARYDARSTSEAVTDDDGNEFVPVDLHVMVTYPSHGGADVALAFNRTTFLTECCLAAMKLRNEFMVKKVYDLLRSAEDKRKREQEKNAEVVRKAVICNCKGMRVGQSKKFCDGTFSDQLVPGTYNFTIDKKNYTAEVSDSKVVEMTRHVAPPIEAEIEVK